MLLNNLNLLTTLVCEPGAPYQSDSQKRWIEVLVDSPGAQGLFTYSLPPELDVKPGDILSVPFGQQQLGGVAIRQVDCLPEGLSPEKIKDVEDIITTGFFPANYWLLLEKVANYYQTPLIQVIKTALPPGLLLRSQRRIRLLPSEIPSGAAMSLNATARQVLEFLQGAKSNDYTWQYIRQQIRGANRGLRDLIKRGWVESYLENQTPTRPKKQLAVVLLPDAFNADLTTRQREILEILRRYGGELWQTKIIEICKTSSSTIKELEKKGCIVIEEKEILRTAKSPMQEADQAKILTNYQQCALEVINNLNGFHRVLLHGVTGSGKTEVYLQAIAPILEKGKSALVLVPEIGLTPQLTDRFKARFGEKVYIYHSGLSDGERYDTWRQMLTGEPQIIIGTRSAIFAPLPKLSLIVLDEEYDSSFKQDKPAPTYHARTVANWRAELENCPLILGSATPSLETWLEFTGNKTKISNSNTHYLSLPERIRSRPMPPVEVVDMRHELRQGNRSIFSLSLQNALQQLQENQQQGILFIHRRGHSTFVSCRSCGYVIECPNCDVSLSYHYEYEGATQLLRCHYCNYSKIHPEFCPECNSPYLKNFGSGTQRVGQELAKYFPGLKFIRFDSDTTQTKDAHRILLTRFARGEANLLIGTQMLTKGLDLPQVTLVGIVAADGLLNLSDYRASERAFQTLTQVAGRAGRGDEPGKVILQTYTPEHPVIQAVRHHEYEAFIQRELEERAALNYPPYGRLILLRLSGEDEGEVEAVADRIAAVLEPSDEELAQGYELLGPAPATIMRIANRFRWQIMLKFPGDRALNLTGKLESIKPLCPAKISLTIDVDPLNIG